MPSFAIAWARRTGHQWRKNAEGMLVAPAPVFWNMAVN